MAKNSTGEMLSLKIQLDAANRLIVALNSDRVEDRLAISRNNEIIHKLNLEKQSITERLAINEASLKIASSDNARLNTDLNDANGALKSTTSLNNVLRQEIDEARAQLANLREQIQRSLGYIDRVNEDSPPPHPASIEPERAITQMRGPRLNTYYDSRQDGLSLRGASGSNYR